MRERKALAGVALAMPLLLMTIFPAIVGAQNSPPQVSTVTAMQETDATRLVTVGYDLTDAEGDTCRVFLQVSADGGATWDVPALSVSGDVGEGIIPGTGKLVTWNPWADAPGLWGSQFTVRVAADDGQRPAGMALVPEGAFAMGCHAGTGENCDADELPVHQVHLSSFEIGIHEVTNTQYAAYLNSALGQGLVEVLLGEVFKAGDVEVYCETAAASSYSRITWDGSVFDVVPGEESHPVTMVSWYGAAAYTNWRSTEGGRTPCYDLETWACDAGAGGYRLPREAEWEKAARGGERDPYLVFPWGNTIDGSEANFYNSGDPYETGSVPHTTPVGYYDGGQLPAGVDMANGYGLYDMAGNVWEWCNDWYADDYYGAGPYQDPAGPADGDFRVARGGSWNFPAGDLSCAERRRNFADNRFNYYGFRLAKNAGSVGSGDSAPFALSTRTVAGEFTCEPSSGTVPFATGMTATLENLHPGATRRIAGRIDLLIASGASFGSWKAGWSNVGPLSSLVQSWNQPIPALGTLIGVNDFTLVAEDVTPAPYNQPPFPASGDTDRGTCSLTASAP